jgi:hypothetical protein
MGGMMFGNTVPIAKDEVQPTLDSFQTDALDAIGIREHVPIGSTGKKAFSGDLDVAVSLPTGMDKRGFVGLLSTNPSIGSENVRMSGSLVSVSYPIAGTERRVQIDVMFSSSADPRSMGWLMAGTGDGAVKGIYRNLLLSFVAKQASQRWGTKMTISFPGGLTDPESEGRRTEDPQRILDLLGIDASPEQTLTFDGLAAAIGKNPDLIGALMDPINGFEKYLERYINDPKTHEQAMHALRTLHRSLQEGVRTFRSRVLRESIKRSLKLILNEGSYDTRKKKLHRL